MIEIRYENICCPVCNSSSFENIYSKTINEICLEGIINVSVSLSICKECGLVYQNPVPTESSLNDYYSLQSECTDSGTEIRPLYFEMYDFIKSRIELEKIETVLDIGCRRGEMLRLFKSDGKKVLGIEPSKFNSEFVEKTFDIPVMVDIFRENMLQNEKFDIIILSNILEHVRNTFEFLLSVKGNIRENGFLFISVPFLNAALNKRFFSSLADYFCFQHLQHFTLENLRILLDRCGFEIKNHDSSESALYVLCNVKNNEEEITKTISFKNEYKENLKVVQEYISLREVELEDILNRIRCLKGKKVVIYGAGAHTTQLMQVFDIGSLDLEGICDGDVNKYGLLIGGFKVCCIEDIDKDAYSTVVISSKAYESEIFESLSKLLPQKQIIKIYT